MTRVLLILVVCLAATQPKNAGNNSGVTADVSAGTPARANSFVPLIADPKVQERLAVLAATKRDTEEHFRELIALKALARQLPGGLRELVRQGAIYDSTHPQRPTLQHVAWFLGYDRYLLLVFLLPYHDSPDERVRNLVERLHEGGGRHVSELSVWDPIVRALIDYVQVHLDDPPWPLVRALFHKAPSVAVLEVSRSAWSSGGEDGLQKRRAVFWAQHVVEDVVWKHATGFLQPGDVQRAEAELDKLSRFDEWWVRLYVAEMLCRHDDIFAAPEIRQRLGDDPNPLVVESINDRFSHGMTEDEQRAWGRLPPATRQGRD